MESVTVYIDILFLVNFTVDYFLLLAAGSLRRLNYSKLRLLIPAAVGGVYSCLVFFSPLKPLYSVFGKLAISALMVLTGFRNKGIKSFFITFVCLHGASAALGGIVLGIELVFSPSNMLVSNGEFYINISAFALICTAAAAYALMLVFSRVFRPRGKEILCELSVTAEGRTAKMQALVDSGNMLTDALTGAYVIVASFAALTSVIPQEAQPVFMQEGDITLALDCEWRTRLSLVPLSTVSGKGVLPAFRPDKVTVNGCELSQKVIVAVKNGILSEKYDAIVGNVT